MAVSFMTESKLSGTRSVPALGDLDGDDDLDLIAGNEDGNFICFTNAGTSNLPSFVRIPGANPLRLSSGYSRSAPVLGDLDGDDDLDLIAGNEDGNFICFTNAGTSGFPSFVRIPEDNPFGLANIGGSPASALQDLDGDGDLDLIVGNEDGNFICFTNAGTSGFPSFVRIPGANPLGLANIGLNAAPALQDLDGDDDLDLIVGNEDRNFICFTNAGTSGFPSFVRIPGANPLRLANIGGSPASALQDLDGDGDLDLIAGNEDGNFICFTNAGTSGFPSFVRIPEDNPLGLGDIGLNAAPALQDLDGDGDFDLIAGNFSDRLIYYQNQ